jgi:phospholipid transport system substrate-binding protein
VGSFLRAAVAAAIIVLPPAAARAQAGDPVARITAYNGAINAIEKAGGSLAQRTARFEPLVRDTYDMTRIATLVAGPAWARASAAERDAATAALVHHSALSLARNFKGPGATGFRVDPKPIDRAGSKIVKVGAGGDTLYYRLNASGGGWKIIDVISGGVSQLALQRADLAGTVASGGVAALTTRLGQLDKGR